MPWGDKEKRLRLLTSRPPFAARTIALDARRGRGSFVSLTAARRFARPVKLPARAGSHFFNVAMVGSQSGWHRSGALPGRQCAPTAFTIANDFMGFLGRRSCETAGMLMRLGRGADAKRHGFRCRIAFLLLRTPIKNFLWISSNAPKPRPWLCERAPS